MFANDKKELISTLKEPLQSHSLGLPKSSSEQIDTLSSQTFPNFTLSVSSTFNILPIKKAFEHLNEKIETTGKKIYRLESEVSLHKFLNIEKLEIHNSSTSSLQNSRDPLDICKLIEKLIERCTIKTLSKKESLLSFNKQLGEFAKKQSLKEPSESDYLTVLGKFFYFVSVDLVNVGNLIFKNHFASSIKKINSEFSLVIELTKNKLSSLKFAHENTELQSAELAIQTALPFALAQFLVTSLGTINFLLIPTLKEEFLNNEQSRPFEKDFSYVLTCLSESPSLCAQLASLEAPCTPRAPANLILKLSLSMSKWAPMTNFGVQQIALAAVLAALTSHWRQRKGGSCFATSLAIGLLSSQLELCIKDFAELIKTGKLSRTIDNNVIDFSFLLLPDFSSLKKVLVISRKGELIKKNSDSKCLCDVHHPSKLNKEEKKNEHSFLWEAPGLLKACSALAIDPKTAYKHIVNEIFSATTNNEPIEITLEELLNRLVSFSREKYSAENRKEKDLFTQAALAFESQTYNLLLKAWENAIAGMAEGLKNSLIKNAIVDAILKVLKNFLFLFVDVSDKKIELFFSLINKKLLDEIHLLYDLSLGIETQENVSSTYGAFVLYKSSSNERIDCPTKFASFVKSVIEQNFQSNFFTKKLIEYVSSSNFIIDVICEYSPGSILEGNPLKDYKKMKYTPWVMFCGNRSKAAFQVYFGKDIANVLEEYTASTAAELLIKILDFREKLLAKKSSEEASKLRFVPVSTVGVHAFSLKLFHASLPDIALDKGTYKEWIEKKVVGPGIEIANSILQSEQKKKLVEWIKSCLIPELKQSIFDLYLSSLPLRTSVKEYRETIKMFLQEEVFLPATFHKPWLCSLDTALYHCLPRPLQFKLESSAVCFADTNWHSGHYDLHFCFVVNPGSGNMEMWECYSDGSNLAALDQNQWVSGQIWEFYHPSESLFYKTQIRP